MNNISNAINSVALFLKKYEYYFMMLVKFVLAIIIFNQLKNNLGYSSFFNNGIIIFGLSLACAVIPSNLFALIVGMVTLIHLYRLSLIICVIAGILLLLIYLMYLKFAPEQGLLMVAVPALIPFNLHFALAMGAGLMVNPFTIVPACGGVIIYYIIDYLKTAADSVGSSTEIRDIISSVKGIFDGIMDNKDMAVLCMVFITVIIIVFLVGKRSFPFAWYIGLGLGIIGGIIAVNVFNKMLNGNLPVGKTAVGLIIGALIIGVLQFLFHNVHYSKREALTFEDEEYVYYVKALPKKIQFEEQEETGIKDALNMLRKKDKKEEDKKEKAEIEGEPAPATGDTIVAGHTGNRRKKDTFKAEKAVETEKDDMPDLLEDEIPFEDAKEPERDKTSILEEEDLGGIPEIKSNKKEKDKKTPGERRAERLKKAREEREKRRREREAAAAAEPEDIDDILEEELAAEDTTADSAYAERRRKRLERAERRRAEGKKYKENTEDIKELLPEDQAETSGDNIPMVKEDQRSFFLDPDGESFDEITSEDIGDHLDK